MAECFYTTGGTVQAQEGGIYLSRPADQQLLELCRQSRFAYVLTPRQLGKSSLMIRTAEELQAEGFRAVTVDLTQIGTGSDAEQWYGDVLEVVADQLELTTNARVWWKQQVETGITLRLTRFFEEVVLAEAGEPIVIFVDEIDTTLSLEFTDDFFAAIRYLYVARAQNPALRRLSFVLIGVATPADLIRDPKRTPFNIGERVDLRDFTPEEAKPLAQGLPLPAPEAVRALGWILGWTGGHPYLSQRLCSVLAADPPTEWSEAAVDQAVGRNFFGERSEQDNNLQFVRDMITKRAPQGYGAELLRTYRSIWQGKQPVADEEQNLVHAHLKLAGVVRRDGRQLVVRNRLYREVFNVAWIGEHNPEDFWKRYGPVLKWVSAFCLSALLIVSILINLVFEARHQAALANVRQELAEVLTVLPSSEVTPNLDLAMFKAIDAWGRTHSVPEARGEATSALMQVWTTYWESKQFKGHEGPVSAVTFSPDGKRLATSGDDGTIRIWNSTNGNALREPIKGHYGKVTSVAFSPDSRYIASSGIDQRVRLWDATTLSQVNTLLDGHSGAINSVAFSSDGHIIGSGGDDGTIRRWKLDDEKTQELPPLRAHSGRVNSIAFSPNSMYMASGGDDSAIRLWNWKTGERIGVMIGHTGGVNSVSFSPDGLSIVSSSNDRTIRVWDVSSHQEISCLRGHQDYVKSAVFNSNGKIIVSASDDGSIRLWDLTKGESYGQPLKGHVGYVSSVSYSPNDLLIASSGQDGTVRLWNPSDGATSGAPLIGHEGRVNTVAFSPDSNMLASGGKDRAVRLWDLANGEVEVRPLGQHDDHVDEVIFSPDGQRVASGGDDGMIYLWDIKGGNITKANSHQGRVTSLAFSPNGQQLASGGADSSVKVWDALTMLNQKSFLQCHKGSVKLIVYSQDGSHFATGGEDAIIRIWDMTSDKTAEQSFSGHQAYLTAAWFSRDNRQMISIDLSGEMRFWDLGNGKCLKIVQLTGTNYLNSLRKIAFSDDGQMIVAGFYDGSLRIWDVYSGMNIGLPLKGHDGYVSSVDFSPDGNLIVSAGDDGTVRVWGGSPEGFVRLACTHLTHHSLIKDIASKYSESGFSAAYNRVLRTCQEVTPASLENQSPER